MNTLIIGANGKIGRILCERCAQEKVPVRAMVRSPEQQERFHGQGVQTVVGDLSGELAPAFDGIDQVVFTAGSGGHTGPEHTLLVDLNGALRAIDLSVERGVKHFIMISAFRVHDVLGAPEKLRPYMAAKAAADRILCGSGLHHTILRPGRLTDEPATGRVRTERGDSADITIARADVAECTLALLDDLVPSDRIIDLLSGEMPISELRAPPSK